MTTTKTTSEEWLSRIEGNYAHRATKGDVARLRAEMQVSIAKLLGEIKIRDAESKVRDAQSKVRYTEIMGLIAGINVRVDALRREMAAK